MSSTERQRFAPHLVLERRLGSGGQGEVWRAFDEDRGCAVAVKVLRPGPDWRSLARFTQEAQLLEMLDHPGLVKLIASDLTGERPWLELELVRGRTLRDVLVDHVSRSERTSIPWTGIVIDQVCRALAYAHARGVVHRDLKPTNVIVDEGEVPLVKVIDLGIAKWLAQTDGQATTVSRGFVGTLPFLAPEQILGHPVSERTDVHQVGVLLFTMLAQRSPWTEPHELIDQVPSATLGSRILVATRPRLTRLRADAPPALDAVLARAMAIDPEQRFPSMDALRTALAQAISGDGPLEAAATKPERSLDELYAPPQPVVVSASDPDTAPSPAPLPDARPRARTGTRRGERAPAVADLVGPRPFTALPPNRGWVALAWPVVFGIWGLVALVYVVRMPAAPEAARVPSSGSVLPAPASPTAAAVVPPAPARPAAPSPSPSATAASASSSASSSASASPSVAASARPRPTPSPTSRAARPAARPQPTPSATPSAPASPSAPPPVELAPWSPWHEK